MALIEHETRVFSPDNSRPGTPELRALSLADRSSPKARIPIERSELMGPGVQQGQTRSPGRVTDDTSWIMRYSQAPPPSDLQRRMARNLPDQEIGKHRRAHHYPSCGRNKRGKGKGLPPSASCACHSWVSDRGRREGGARACKQGVLGGVLNRSDTLVHCPAARAPRISFLPDYNSCRLRMLRTSYPIPHDPCGHCACKGGPGQLSGSPRHPLHGAGPNAPIRSTRTGKGGPLR